MTERLAMAADDELIAGLRALAPAIAWPGAGTEPGAGPDVATRVRVRLQDAAGGSTAGDRVTTRRRPWWRPASRAVLIALIALAAIVAVAGAVGLGLPGLRISLGGGPTPPPATIAPSPGVVSSPGASSSASATPSPTPGPLGSTLRLGRLTALEDLDQAAGRHIPLPTDPLLGLPDTAWVDAQRGRQVALVWRAKPGLPETREPGIGLILMSFGGTMDPGFYQKIIDSGTTLEKVTVDGKPGFWFDGDPHVFFYVTGSGGVIDDPRRWVGRALAWTDGGTTYRIETALPRADAMRIAGSLP
jgi:hypothetical protein